MSLLFKGLFKHQDFGLFVYRVVIGLAVFMHGLAKIQSSDATIASIGSAVQVIGIHSGFYEFGLVAAFSEMIGGLLVAIGLFTRLGSLFVTATLFMAFLLQYDASFSKWIYPVEVGVGFLMILIGGPGRFSIDYMIAGKR